MKKKNIWNNVAWRISIILILVSNRSTFKFPSAIFTARGSSTPFLPCTDVTELPTESFQANGARAYHVGNELIDSPLQHDACLITAWWHKWHGRGLRNCFVRNTWHCGSNSLWNQSGGKIEINRINRIIFSFQPFRYYNEERRVCPSISLPCFSLLLFSFLFFPAFFHRI